ncbi:MAG: hypothetical protein ACRERT_15300, partial [Pseudomonas sp.]
METQIASPVQVAAPALSLEDLFVSRPSASAGNEGLGASLTLDQGFAQDWQALLGTTGYLPDTLFAAAWLLLQSRWLGQPVLPSSGTAGAWLAQFDPARRAAAGSSETPDTPVRLQLDARPGYPACLHLHTPAGLMDAPCADRLLAAIADTAADLLARPGAALADIRTLPDADRDDQLAAWNTPPAALDLALTVPALFSRRAAAAPHAVALAEGDATMRYDELDARTDRLAQRLQ